MMKTIRQFSSISGYVVTMLVLYLAFTWYTVRGVKITGDDSPKGNSAAAVRGPGAHSNNHFYHK